MNEHPLKTYRTSAGLTQGQLAEILGVSDATITHVENGRRRVTAENALEWEKKIPVTKEVLRPDLWPGRQRRKVA